MKLTNQHIGKLFHNRGADGSWVYQLVDIKKGQLLFYDFGNRYWLEDVDKSDDWEYFKPLDKWPKKWLKIGWSEAKA